MSRACSAIASVRPRRIEPGGSGECFIVLVLRDRAVLPANAPFELDYDAEQGPLSLGTWQREPPEGAVYDNTATVRIPVSVAAGTAYGRYPLALEIRTDLHDAETGDLLGHYGESVGHDIEVGAPVPRPTRTAAPTATGEAAAREDDVETLDAEPPAAQGDTSSPTPAAEGRFADHGAAESIAAERSTDLPPTDSGGVQVPLLALAGAALFVALAVLIWRHGRVR